ncbi:hypothetical protein [Mycolicibacterium fortuitum]|uniref:hypothetical protein n=1 Tax=Mycolicibacterium fortuitum TaxID=1766 RepID=UPI001A95FC4D|nr:hypothetical protein [Mycolicibacterium fortuitum]
MALITEFTQVAADHPTVHGRVSCGWRVFQHDGHTVLQLDTYGSPERKIKGKVSQSIQLDHDGAKELVKLIKGTFPDL